MPELPRATIGDNARIALDLRQESDFLEAKRSGGERRQVVRVSLGEPLFFDLGDVLRQSDADLPTVTRLDLDRYEFHLVRFALSVHHGKNAGATWLDFAVSLQYQPQAPGQTGGIVVADPAAAPPIVYDLNPMNVDDVKQVESKTSISPTFTFNKVEAGGIGKEITLTYERHEPKVTAYGKRDSKAGWRLERGTSKYVAPGVKELDLIVRKNKRTSVRCGLMVSGEGQTTWGPLRSKHTVPEESQSFYL